MLRKLGMGKEVGLVCAGVKSSDLVVFRLDGAAKRVLEAKEHSSSFSIGP